MKSFASSATIRAAPETIWHILTDAAGCSTWDTAVSRVDRLIASGEITMREDCSGRLTSPITKSIPDLQPAFDEIAACLSA